MKFLTELKFMRIVRIKTVTKKHSGVSCICKTGAGCHCHITK